MSYFFQYRTRAMRQAAVVIRCPPVAVYRRECTGVTLCLKMMGFWEGGVWEGGSFSF